MLCGYVCDAEKSGGSRQRGGEICIAVLVRECGWGTGGGKRLKCVVESVVDVSLRHVASHSGYVTEQTPRPLNSSDRKRAKTSGRGERAVALTLAPEPLGSPARSWSVVGRE